MRCFQPQQSSMDKPLFIKQRRSNMKYVFVFPAVMIICSLVGCGMVNEITGINGRISRNTTPQVGQTVYLCAENGFGMGVSLNQDGVSLEDNDQGTVIQSGTDQYANYVLVKFT